MRTPRQRYENTREYERLLETNSLSDFENWMIQGENPNPDFSSSPYNPILRFVEGKLDDVINFAVSLDGFWQWGSGGRITKINIYKI
jgi:hypothetical protein